MRSPEGLLGCAHSLIEIWLHTHRGIGTSAEEFFVVVVGISQEDPIFGKQGGKLEMSAQGLQGDDKVAGFLGWVGRAAREPGVESEVSICVRVGQR